jgi:AcrR family transcriptional regulator
MLPAVAPRPDRPALRARYDAKQQAMIEAAARVFAERGYDQTSVQELSESLGIAAGSLYHYFGSKEQLLFRICDQLMEPLLERARELVAVEAPAAEQLRALVHMWVAHVVEHRAHMLVFGQERHVIERSPQWGGVRASRKAFERLVDELLARAEAAGALHFADRRVTLSALLGMVNSTAQWYRPGGRLIPEEVAGGYLELLGLRVVAPVS